MSQGIKKVNLGDYEKNFLNFSSTVDNVNKNTQPKSEELFSINSADIYDTLEGKYLNLSEEELHNQTIIKKYSDDSRYTILSGSKNENTSLSNIITSEMLETGLTGEQLKQYVDEQSGLIDKYIETIQENIGQNDARLEELNKILNSADTYSNATVYNAQQIASFKDMVTKLNGYDGTYKELCDEIKTLKADNMQYEGIKSNLENQKINFKDNSLLFTKDYKKYDASLTTVKPEEIEIKNTYETDEYGNTYMVYSASFEDYKKSHSGSKITSLEFYQVAQELLNSKKADYEGFSKIKVDLPYTSDMETLIYMKDKNHEFVKIFDYLVDTNLDEAKKYLENNKDTLNKYKGLMDAETEISQLTKIDDENIKKFSEEYKNVDFTNRESVEKYLNKINDLDIDNKDEVLAMINELNYSNSEELELAVAQIVDTVNGSARIQEDLLNALNITSDGLYDGIYDFGEGFAKLGMNGEITAQDYKAMVYISYLEEHSVWYGKLYQGSSAVGNMLPSVTASALIASFAPELIPALNAVTSVKIGKNVALGLNAISSFGTTQNQLKYEGYSDWQAYLYAGTSSLSEIGTEKLLGGILGLADDAGRSLLHQMLNEGREEAIQQLFQSGILDTFILGKDLDFGELTQETIDSFIIGASMAGVLNTYSGSLNYMVNGIKYRLHSSDCAKISEFMSAHPDMTSSEILSMVTGASEEILSTDDGLTSVEGAWNDENIAEEQINLARGLSPAEGEVAFETNNFDETEGRRLSQSIDQSDIIENKHNLDREESATQIETIDLSQNINSVNDVSDIAEIIPVSKQNSEMRIESNNPEIVKKYQGIMNEVSRKTLDYLSEIGLSKDLIERLSNKLDNLTVYFIDRKLRNYTVRYNGQEHVLSVGSSVGAFAAYASQFFDGESWTFEPSIYLEEGDNNKHRIRHEYTHFLSYLMGLSPNLDGNYDDKRGLDCKTYDKSDSVVDTRFSNGFLNEGMTEFLATSGLASSPINYHSNCLIVDLLTLNGNNDLIEVYFSSDYQEFLDFAAKFKDITGVDFDIYYDSDVQEYGFNINEEKMNQMIKAAIAYQIRSASSVDELQSIKSQIEHSLARYDGYSNYMIIPEYSREEILNYLNSEIENYSSSEENVSDINSTYGRKI